MGNRAVITTEAAMRDDGLGVYLRWNGGRDSVEAFLEYCRLRKFRSPEDSYGMARLCQVIANFFGGSLCIGIDTLWHLDMDNGDNGVYVVNRDWEITRREYFSGPEQNGYDRIDFMVSIDKKQPEEEQLGEEYIRAKDFTPGEIAVGDKVWVSFFGERPELHEVVGIGKEGRTINGVDVSGIPYVDMYGGNFGYDGNINNYLRGKSYRVKW